MLAIEPVGRRARRVMLTVDERLETVGARDGCIALVGDDESRDTRGACCRGDEGDAVTVRVGTRIQFG